MPSFEFHETMAGSVRLEGGDERAMSFTVRAYSGSMLGFLRRPRLEIEGEVDIEGFADHRHLRGSLSFDLFRQRRLSYHFDFRDNSDALYTFTGEKTIKDTGLVESMTILPGKIRNPEGTEIGDALLRFDLRSDLLKFIKSFKART